DGDALGDACDSCPGDSRNDQDADGICEGTSFSAPKTGDHDNCPTTANAGQTNADGDGSGDACDVCPGSALNDQDGAAGCGGAGVNPPKIGQNDNCPAVPNPGQTNTDGDPFGDACDSCPGDAQNDQDGDDISAGTGFSAPKTGDHDNCPAIANTSQTNGDSDTLGDACDSCPGDTANDADGDGICAGTGFGAPKTGDHDNCPATANIGQSNGDGDTLGDACDNCPAITNQNQANGDADALGDACDACPLDAQNDAARDNRRA